jgi:hypothetical protein
MFFTARITGDFGGIALSGRMSASLGNNLPKPHYVATQLPNGGWFGVVLE